MYAKVFSSLFDGSMRGQPDLILVFINMLTRCDSDGCVDRTPRAIADETGLPIERVKDAIKMLESPDSESRTPDMEGRRIVLVSGERTWGWQIVNFRKYRSIRDEQSRRQQNREAQQRYKSKTNKPESAKVSQEKPDKPEKAHTEAEAEAHTETETDTPIVPKGTTQTNNTSEQKLPEQPQLLACPVNQPPAKKVRRGKKVTVYYSELSSERKADVDKMFELFWEKYPCKEEKAKAINSFVTAMTKTTIEKILDAVDKYAASKKVADGFIKMPATWLNNGCWDDQIAPHRSKSGLPVPSNEELKAMGPKWGTNRAE